jgi:low temperature requirement protein LtrA
VFVLAITQVTAMMADDPTWEGLARGLIVLAALWWCWAAYAWLTNAIDPDEGGTRIAMLTAMTGILIVAIAVPGAFNENAFEFGIAYAFVRLMHLILYAVGTRNTDALAAVKRMTPTSLAAPALIIAASFFDGVPQGLFWVTALVLDYGGVLIGRGRGWTLYPAHFAERYGLIVLIALGESIVALGIGASSSLELTSAEIAAAALAAILASALWWTYFDVTALVAERRLSEAQGAERARLARDSYSYLHLPLIAGIVLLALGIKKTLEKTSAPLDDVTAFALCGGVGLYLLGHVARRARAMHTFGTHRFIAAVVAFALIPVAQEIDALASLAVLAAVTSTLVAYEYVRFRESRSRLRAAAH